MATSRQKAKGRRESGSFVAVPKVVLNSKEYSTLGAHAVKLLIDLLAQYNGKNNGDLCAAWSLMHPRGWRSKGTLAAAIADLKAAGWIVTSRQGGRNRPSLYAITFLAVDECGGKLEMTPTRVPPSLWKKSVPA